MAMLQVDLRGITPALTLTPVPEAWYKVRIVKSNMKGTAKGDGGYLELIHEILEGQYQGRLVYWNLNLFNPSQQAVEIAYKQLSAIGHCIGVFNVQDQSVPDSVVPMLHNIPYQIWVVVAQGNQGPINNVRGCKDINGNEPGKQGMGAPALQPQQPTGQWPQQGQQPGQQQPGAWQAPGAQPQAGTAPGGWPGVQPAAPQGPQGQPWQPGTNQQPTMAAPAWQPQQPAQQPPPNQWPQPGQQPQQPQQQQPNQPAVNWQQGGQPTQPAQQPQNPAGQWTQGQPAAAAPWQRPA